MFKVFLLVSFFFALPATAQQSIFANDESSQENLLSKYTNARAICARMTDPAALYERGMLLAADENDDAYLAAADCFMAAATRNHTPSQIELGKMYEYGRGVPPSDIFAYKWYQTAVLLGDKAAVTPRNRLENAMSINDIAMSIPLIQETLDLLDLYASRQDEDLLKKEKELEQQYRELFGINLPDFDPPESEASTKSDNPLVEALIQAQLQKEAEAKMKKAAAAAGMQMPNTDAFQDGAGAMPQPQRRNRRRRQQEAPLEEPPPPPREEVAATGMATGMSSGMSSADTGMAGMGGVDPDLLMQP